jgi:signal transduction histidine kinase
MKQSYNWLGILLWGIFWIFQVVPGWAADLPQNQVQNQLNHASVPEKIGIYNQLSRSSVYSDPQKSISYAQKALELAISTGDKRGEAEAYTNLGMGYYFKSDYDQLLDFYKKSLQTYRQLGDEKSIAGLASMYYRINQSEQALKNYQQSLILYIKQKDYARQVESYRSMGDVYKGMGDYASALENYTKAIAILNDKAAALPNPGIVDQELSLLLGPVGEIYFYRGEYDEALLFFNELKDLLHRIGDRQGLAAVLNNIAGTYFFREELTKSYDTYAEALRIQEEQNDHYGAAMTLLNMGKIFSKRNILAQALWCHQKSIVLAEIVTAKDLLKENYLELSRIYARQKDYQLAYRNHLLFSDVAGAMSVEENVSQFINTLAIYDLEQKRQENEILQARNENYKLILEKESLKRWRISFVFTTIIILILTFLAFYRYISKRNENRNLELRINEALKKQEEQQQIIVHQASLTSLGELAAGIAHEINQPMQNISLSAESIRIELSEQKPDHAFVKQSVEEIFEDILRVREIVDHIRVFSSGQKEQVFESFDVSECVRSAVSMVGRQLVNHRIELRLELSPSLPHVLGNPHKLEQVVHNLLSNARDAVEEQKQKMSWLDMQIGVSTRVNQNKEVILEVTDNGCGIPLNKQTDIFLPFFTTKKLGQGTGLGLSISHSLVKEMGGRIELESRIGKGTMMRVILPAHHHEN